MAEIIHFQGRPALRQDCWCVRDENSGEILWCPDCYEKIMTEENDYDF